MSDKHPRVDHVSAWRKRLKDIQLAAGTQSAGPERPPSEAGIETLTGRLAAGHRHDAFIDASIRTLGQGTPDVLPTRLTAHARRLLERGRDLLARLRALAYEFDLAGAWQRGMGETTGPRQPAEPDPLADWYRKTVAMTDTSLRALGALPDAPSVQLRLCQGLEAMLEVIVGRVDAIALALDMRRKQVRRLDGLSGFLTRLHLEAGPEMTQLTEVAEQVAAEAAGAMPLRFGHWSPEEPARHVACHSLNVASVIARLTLRDDEFRGRPLEPILAALTCDVGMLSVPRALLAQKEPLDDAQRRVLEGHPRMGAAILARAFPDETYLAQAAANHHERLDGTGYPAGLKGGQLAQLERLLAVCDMYAARCAPRPQRPARQPRTALTDTLLDAERGILDRYHAERLLELSFYPVGSVVELADGALGLVVAAPRVRQDLGFPARPVVAILSDAQGRMLDFPSHVDLGQCDGRSIVRSLSTAECRAVLGARHPEMACA
jgi:HD-GYP domain-containing protein (c-di-GMP phosphodiesterase class II)